MKKFLICIFALIAALCVSACAERTADAEVLESGERFLVLRARDTDTSASLGDAMTSLKNRGEISFEASEGVYGLYVLSVNGVAADGDEYWAVYTSLGEYGGVEYSYESSAAYEYGGTVCRQANYGVDGLPLVRGALYILSLESY